MTKQLIGFTCIIFGALLAACGTVATPVWMPNTEATKAAETATEAGKNNPVAAAPTNTPAPSPTTPPTAAPTEALTSAAPATEVAAAPTVPPTNPPAQVSAASIRYVGPGNVARGKKLFETFQDKAGYACVTCHFVDKPDRLIGPGLKAVAEWSAQNIKDQKPQDYIRASIVNPSAFIVPEYVDNLMPKVYKDIFNAGQIEDLVAYVMSLR
jgi:cytochrome c551/c552